MKRFRSNLLLMALLPGLCSSLYAAEGVRPIAQWDIPMAITQPGHYRLVGNLAVTGAAPGIMIRADHVTLDLNGFVIRAADAAASIGIQQSNVYQGAVIRNGSLIGWNGVEDSAIWLEGTHNTIEGVAVRESRAGIRAGGQASVTSCSFVDNHAIGTVIGIEAGDGSRIHDCRVVGNSGTVITAILAGDGAAVSDCVVHDNQASGFAAEGIRIGSAGRIERCAVQDLSADIVAYGIAADDTVRIRACTLREIVASAGDVHAAFGLDTGYGSVITLVSATGIGGGVSNGAAVYTGGGANISLASAYENAVPGFRLGSDSLLTRSLAMNHAATPGITIDGSRNRIENNHAVMNATGIKALGTNNLIIRNTLAVNAQAGAVNTTNALAETLIRPGQFDAAATPVTFENIVW